MASIWERLFGQNKLGEQAGTNELQKLVQQYSQPPAIANLPPELRGGPLVPLEPLPPLPDYAGPPPEIISDPNPLEIATLIVNGQNFTDWESVWVQHRWADGYPMFRFTAAERNDIPSIWTKLQWRPGQPVVINLGGVQVVDGYISVRQVAYDATNHMVELQGAGRQKWAIESSVHTEDNQGNFDNMDHFSICQKVLAPFGIPAVPIGQMNARKFEYCQANPGEKVWDFLERLARVRGHVLGSDHMGNLLVIGPHTYSTDAVLVEGYNIKKCQAVIDIGDFRNMFVVTGQGSGNDQTNGKESAEIKGDAGGQSAPPSFSLTPAEQPIQGKPEADERAYFESIWTGGAIMTVHITVQGWWHGTSGIWRAGSIVEVYSPMIPYQGALKVKTVTYTQDSQRGTETEMELVVPWALRDQHVFDTSTPPPGTTVTPDQRLPLNAQPPDPRTLGGGGW